MARTDGGDSDGEGRERGKNSKKRWGGVRCANSEVDDLVFAGPLWADRYDAFIVSTSGPSQCLRECSPVRIMTIVGKVVGFKVTILNVGGEDNQESLARSWIYFFFLSKVSL
jgi:hypothetical protein